MDKKSRKSKEKWEWACIENEKSHWKLKTPIKTRFANKSYDV
jgi:hypothetical protein